MKRVSKQPWLKSNPESNLDKITERFFYLNKSCAVKRFANEPRLSRKACLSLTNNSSSNPNLQSWVSSRLAKAYQLDSRVLIKSSLLPGRSNKCITTVSKQRDLTCHDSKKQTKPKVEVYKKSIYNKSNNSNISSKRLNLYDEIF
jgi:hypothetical protein